MNACTEWNMGMRLIHMQVYTCLNNMYITIDTCIYMCMYMRDEERRKKEASKVIQTTKQSNTTHQRQSLSKENELPHDQVGLESTTLYTLDRALATGGAVLLCLVICLTLLSSFLIKTCIEATTENYRDPPPHLEAGREEGSQGVWPAEGAEGSSWEWGPGEGCRDPSLSPRPLEGTLESPEAV